MRKPTQKLSLAIGLLGLFLASGPALGQSAVLQAGSATAGHPAVYANTATSTSQAVVRDGGPASGGAVGVGLSEFNVTATGTGTAPYNGQGSGPSGTIGCFYDGPTTGTGYHYLCFSPNSSSAGLITYGASGSATNQDLKIDVNGTLYTFPGSFGLLGSNNTWTGTNTFSGAVTATAGATFSTTGVTFSSGITSSGTNAWSGANTFAKNDLLLGGTSSGTLTLNSGNTSATSYTITLPAGTTDFSATGGTSQVVKQTTAGGAFTVGQLSNTDISGLGTAATQNTGTSGATIGLLDGVNTYSGNSTFTGTVAFNNQISSGAGLPTIASGACGTGTNGTVNAGSTNQTGSITIGATATASCTISFSATLAAAPKACILQPANSGAAAVGTTGAYISAISTSSFVITGTLANTAYYYFCM